jgi:2-dehydro-3-deoxy-D-arabinonate dehydratase
MRLFNTTSGPVAERNGHYFPVPDEWDALVNHANLAAYLRDRTSQAGATTLTAGPRPPLASQEVWAAGVTYLRSRTARMEESETAGGGSFYDKVYQAVRPELFFKSTPWRVRGNGDVVRIRRDARWSVPEPELALVINNRAEVVGYTIGNDMSSRDIEGENPLYLPQAKMYDGSCALGPAMLVRESPLAAETVIDIVIARNGRPAFTGTTTLAQMKRTPEELVGFLYREMSFPKGAILLTGTGIIPPDAFTLESGDEVAITIEPIGTLRNRVA